MKITFIGLGIMGSRMAKNLLKNNVDLTVYNRSSSAMEPLVTAGAKSSSNIIEAVKEADIVISMLSTPEVVASLFIEEGKVLAHLKEGTIWIDSSTVNPSFSKKMEMAALSHNVHFVDAPVAGTKPHAENAELVFFVGGSEKVVQEIYPYLEMMGKKIMHLGACGMGSNFKMLVNIMLAQSMVVFSEAVLLGEKMGLDKSFLLNTLPNLVVAAPFTKFKASMIAEENYEVQFPLEWMYKDLHLASQTAYEHQQPLLLANLTKEIYANAVQKGYSRLDFAAINKYKKNLNNKRQWKIIF